jgi:hypothetical protein
MEEYFQGTIIEFNQKCNQKEGGLEIKIFCDNVGIIFAGKKGPSMLTNMACKTYGDRFVEVLDIQDYFMILLKKCFLKIENEKLKIYNNEKTDTIVLDFYKLEKIETFNRKEPNDPQIT